MYLDAGHVIFLFAACTNKNSNLVNAISWKKILPGNPGSQFSSGCNIMKTNVLTENGMKKSRAYPLFLSVNNLQYLYYAKSP